ncbi:MAG: polymer-forming cytoskeletal protein [Lachnospiraceae bacterium]|nr:polymer-forming cytoskeletal protein [Lachnospiraceae bacterium]
MGFFQDLKEDLSQAVNELGAEEAMENQTVTAAAAEQKVIIDPKQAEDDLAELEAILREKEEADQAKEKEKEVRTHERKLDMNAIFNKSFDDEVSNITGGMSINGDITSQGSLDLVGSVHGNISVMGKLNVTGIIEGNSEASEIYAESAKITGEIRSMGSVKIGQSTVIIGDIFATSAVIAGAVKGDIDVKGPVILDASAIVMGNIKSKSVQINNGAVIEGMCSQCYADVNPVSFFDELKKGGV